MNSKQDELRAQVGRAAVAAAAASIALVIGAAAAGRIDAFRAPTVTDGVAKLHDGTTNAANLADAQVKMQWAQPAADESGRPSRSR